VFYPDGGVSDIQRAQMVTQEGDNVRVMAVEGNFDDAQTGVKRIFSDTALAERLRSAGVVLSSANSINWGRLAPQIAYYYSAYAQLVASGAVRFGEKVDFSVPTGNFGDILAGYYAKKSGLPVGNLICASNSNNVLTDFLRSGIYDRERPFLLTMSPSMDILISSNLERLLYLLSGDPERVAGWMRRLTDAGRYDVGDLREKARAEGFLGYFADEEETARTIRETWEERRCAVDPHTAVGIAAARQYRAETGEKRPCVVLSTASPFKFAGSMLRCLGRDCPENGFDALDALSEFTGLPVPPPLGALRTRAERFSGTVAPADMAAAVEKWLT
jgi:threonine synthase